MLHRARRKARRVGFSVEAHPGRLSGLSVSNTKSGFYGAFYGRAGRLTAENGGFRPPQKAELRHIDQSLDGGAGAAADLELETPDAPLVLL
jgi:hypothetical protein